MDSVKIREHRSIDGSSYMMALSKDWILLNKLEQGDKSALQVQNEIITAYLKREWGEVVVTAAKLRRAIGKIQKLVRSTDRLCFLAIGFGCFKKEFISRMHSADC